LAEEKAQAQARAKAAAQARAAAERAAKARALARIKTEEQQAAAKARANLAQQIAQSAQRAKARAVARAAAEKAAQAAARGVEERYKALIEARVSAAWVAVPGAAGLHCTVVVRVIAGGQVLSARILKGSGNDVFDRSVISAIYNAVPLPVPKSARKLAYLNPLTFVFTAPKGS
jgi:colicin import membrane protein